MPGLYSQPLDTTHILRDKYRRDEVAPVAPAGGRFHLQT